MPATRKRSMYIVVALFEREKGGGSYAVDKIDYSEYCVG